MGKWRRILLSVIVALGLLGLLYAFVDHGGPAIVVHAITNPQKDELSFQFQVCKEGTTVDAPVSPIMTWEDARTLRVVATAEANCGASWLFGDYTVHGNTIRLEYQAIVPRYLMCNCDQRVSYQIRDIPKKDYRLELTAQPEIYTGWMSLSLVIAMALIAASLAAAYVIAILVVRRLERGNSAAAPQAIRTVRRTAVVLGVLLFLSGAANVVLWFTAGWEMQSAQMNAVVSDDNLKHLGRNAGRERADRDFASGMPRWFVLEESESVPANRPERRLAVIEGGGWAGFESYRKAYVNDYNWRMDKHMPPPPKPRGGPPRKG